MVLSRWARRTRLPLEGQLATYVLAGLACFIVGTQVLLRLAH